MKMGAKILYGCIWFGFVLWFSTYCNGFSPKLVNLIEKKIIRIEIPAQIDFALTLIPWNCLISLLICLPFWLMKKRRADATDEMRAAIEFFSWLLGCNLAGIVFWLIYFPESIGDYSGAPSLSVIEPYAVNDGWSPFQLWCMWWGFVVVSNAFSALMAFLLRQPGKTNDPRTMM
jgi:hypothetical protein